MGVAVGAVGYFCGVETYSLVHYWWAAGVYAAVSCWFVGDGAVA